MHAGGWEVAGWQCVLGDRSEMGCEPIGVGPAPAMHLGHGGFAVPVHDPWHADASGTWPVTELLSALQAPLLSALLCWSGANYCGRGMHGAHRAPLTPWGDRATQHLLLWHNQG